jgi:hypothetical protein
VYDALNVLRAMNIISKKRKEIQWLGLPKKQTSAELQEMRMTEESRQQLKAAITHKSTLLKELVRQVCKDRPRTLCTCLVMYFDRHHHRHRHHHHVSYV